jgi:PilZ domain-containing protein
MQVAAHVEAEPGEEKRRAPRHRSNMMGIVRQHKLPNETIHLLDVSSEGCGFRSRWHIAVGARVWLELPGLEPWAATVAWFDDGRGGLRFERPLHPLVAARFAA